MLNILSVGRKKYLKEKIAGNGRQIGVFNLFLFGWLKIIVLKISTLEIKLQISEKYLYKCLLDTNKWLIFVSSN